MTKQEAFALAYAMVVYDLDRDSAEKALAARDHSGDCTKEPHTCVACVAEESLDVGGRMAELLEEPALVLRSGTMIDGATFRGAIRVTEDAKDVVIRNCAFLP